jgi:head-tail adaptor
VRSETVTRLRAGTTTDPYSNDTVEDWENPAELDITALVPAEPRPSEEPVQAARNAITGGFTLYLPTNTDVTARDRMRVRSDVYDVLGNPALWLGTGLVVQVGRTEG